jgi:hypothetical protein
VVFDWGSRAERDFPNQKPQFYNTTRILLEEWASEKRLSSNIKALLKWAEKITENSRGNYKPAAKRLTAIYLSLTLDRAYAHAVTFNRTRANALASTLDLIYPFISILDRTLSLALERAFEFASKFVVALGNAGNHTSSSKLWGK